MAQKLVYDCTGGTHLVVDLTADEETDLAAIRAAGVKMQQDAASKANQRSTDLSAVVAKAASDPTWAAVARLLGAG